MHEGMTPATIEKSISHPPESIQFEQGLHHVFVAISTRNLPPWVVMVLSLPALLFLNESLWAFALVLSLAWAIPALINWRTPLCVWISHDTIVARGHFPFAARCQMPLQDLTAEVMNGHLCLTTAMKGEPVRFRGYGRSDELHWLVMLIGQAQAHALFDGEPTQDMQPPSELTALLEGAMLRGQDGRGDS